MGRKKSHYKYFCILYTKHGKVFYEKSFLHKGGYFCIIRQILTRKRAKSLILHIMKLHEISYNFYFTHNEIVWNHNEIIYCMQYYAYCIQNRRFWLLCIYTNRGVIYANTHTIYYILTLHLYVLYKVLLRIYEVMLHISTNIIKIYHFSCNFCTFLYQN